jgi:hypothetical protein
MRDVESEFMIRYLNRLWVHDAASHCDATGWVWISLNELRARSARAIRFRYARERGGQMIQAAIKRKYCFDMQISGKVIAQLKIGQTVDHIRANERR